MWLAATILNSAGVEIPKGWYPFLFYASIYKIHCRFFLGEVFCLNMKCFFKN